MYKYAINLVYVLSSLDLMFMVEYIPVLRDVLGYRVRLHFLLRVLEVGLKSGGHSLLEVDYGGLLVGAVVDGDDFTITHLYEAERLAQ